MASRAAAGGTKPAKHERHRTICGEARRRGVVRITELAGRLGVSGETVRRDLDELVTAGQLRRIYGGATPPAGELAAARQAVPEAHARLAAAAAQRVRPGQTVMLSGGAAAERLARELTRNVRGLTLITNAIGVAAACGPEVEVLLCPGSYDAETDCVYGEDTVAYLGRFNADLAVIAGCALSPRGASDARRGSAAVKRAMLGAAARAVLLAAAAENGQTALENVAPLAAFTEIFAEGAAPAPLATTCRKDSVKLTVVRTRPRG